MIKSQVDNYYKELETIYDYSDNHVFLTDIWESLVADKKLSPLDSLVMESLLLLSNDMNPYDESFESNFKSICETLSLFADKGVDEALAIGIAGLSFYGFMESIIDLPITNIKCNSDNDCITALLGRNSQSKVESTGDNTLTVLQALRQTNLPDSSFERFVKSEAKSVELQSHALTNRLLWLPEDNNLSQRKKPVMTPSDFGISEDALSCIMKFIYAGKDIDVTCEDILFKDFCPNTNDIVSLSFGSGHTVDYVAITAFLVFLRTALRLLLDDIKDRKRSLVEMLPIVRYIRLSMVEKLKDRMDNIYIQAGLMSCNAIVAICELDCFHEYSKETRLIAESLFERSKLSSELFFKKKGLFKFGVPDDVYDWMSTILNSSVIPISIRKELINPELYPKAGPCHINFSKFQHLSQPSNDNKRNFIESERYCNSMIRSMVEAVDLTVVSPRVDASVGESGASLPSNMDSLQNPDTIKSCLYKLHGKALEAKNRMDVKNLAIIMEAQDKLLLYLNSGVLRPVDSNNEPVSLELQGIVEMTHMDIRREQNIVKPYSKIKSFNALLKDKEQQVRSIIRECLNG